ncbi:hypothetical protein [Rhizobium sp. FKY42]|uniref:hypothetical protein n=1 Tax=Rhizobium sp. FKY42 TaxID=2562310 RepID=UPI0014853060|nr:hypothetical protein [Rhizobium sp. FKY42]
MLDDHGVRIGLAILGLGLATRACAYVGGLVLYSGLTVAPLILSLLFLLVSLSLMAAPVTGARPAAVALATAFTIDGLSRLPLIALVRFERWRDGVLLASGELLLAWVLASEWLIPAYKSLALLVGISLCVSGHSLLRLALLMRNGGASSSLHGFLTGNLRSWHREMPKGTLPVREEQSVPLAVRLYIWTPKVAVAGSASWPLVDRYLMTFGEGGKPSAGHAALGIDSDLYLSHWPVAEISAGIRDLPNVFYSGRDKDMPGLFPPSYTFECEDWIPADQSIEFRTRNVDAVRAYWNAYRQNTAYNITDRNCSIVVANALELALEGNLRTRHPWLQLARLIVHPALWQASYLRSRAHHMCWTPGLVLDYANLLKQIVDPSARDASSFSVVRTR